MRALRIQLLKPSELDHYGKVFEGKRVREQPLSLPRSGAEACRAGWRSLRRPFVPQVSVENELDVLRQLVAACDTLLKQYPDTAVADQQLAQDAEKFAALSER